MDSRPHPSLSGTLEVKVNIDPRAIISAIPSAEMTARIYMRPFAPMKDSETITVVKPADGQGVDGIVPDLSGEVVQPSMAR